MKKYRLYIDEVGNSDLNNSENPNHRFLSLAGVIFDLKYVSERLHPEVEALKQKYFGSHPDDPIILHRKELVNRLPPFLALREESVGKAFDEELLQFLSEWDYRVITVCLDKKRHNETYSTWRYDPYHYCLAVLLERFSYWLNRQAVQGDVMAESRGGKEDIRLKKSFRNLWENGTAYAEGSQFQAVLTSRELKVKPKSGNIAGLQIADRLAHPSRCEILHEQDLLGRPLAPFARRIISILSDKYDHGTGGRKYGKKFI